MLLLRLVAWMFPVGLMTLGAGVASSQNYPNRPIRIVTAEVGGGTDFASRVIAPGLSGSLGQQVIVENRPSGVIPGEVVAKASPDGHTLLLTGNVFWIAPLLKKTPYDVMSDFSPITMVGSAPTVLVVNPSLPVRSVEELIALAKAKPGELNYASPSAGSSPHLAAELFKSVAGVNIVRVPYRGNAPALSALIGGEVQLTFAVAGAVGPHVKSGRVKALAITSAQPSALFRGLPTVAASGLPGYELIAILGIFAPGKTPMGLINRLNQEIVGVLNRADVKERFLNVGVETVGSTPAEFAATIRSEMAKLGKVISDAGIRAD